MFHRLREYPLIQKDITPELVQSYYLGSLPIEQVTELIKIKANHALRLALQIGAQDAIIDVAVWGVSIWAELMTDDRYDCACYPLSSWQNMDEWLSS